MSGPPIAPGRSCGKCSLCCNVLHVIELNKPAHVWCEHCKPGEGGCQIYDIRPSICRSYACGWLMSDKVGMEWYPMLSHMVLSMSVFGGVNTVTCTVDPDYDGIWMEEPYHSQLRTMATHGLHAKAPKDLLLVQVRVRDQVFLVLPDQALEITKGSYVLKCIGSGQWDVEFYANQTEAAERVVELIR